MMNRARAVIEVKGPTCNNASTRIASRRQGNRFLQVSGARSDCRAGAGACPSQDIRAQRRCYLALTFLLNPVILATISLVVGRSLADASGAAIPSKNVALYRS
jgi:hypothetical protein